jgi:hypothetical protein
MVASVSTGTAEAKHYYWTSSYRKEKAIQTRLRTIPFFDRFCIQSLLAPLLRSGHGREMMMQSSMARHGSCVAANSAQGAP